MTPDLSGTGELSTIIPQIQLPKDAHFNYAVSAIVATAIAVLSWRYERRTAAA